ncbi:HET-domain-containing protein [Thozetella sp. PMI_491]|nr:HET-domain-containing protein [Thozetella sp. PMI_491]
MDTADMVDSSLDEQQRHFDPHLTASTASGVRKVKRHLVPFYPYLEKLSGSHLIDAQPSRSSHPIKVATIRRWLDACEEAHGEHCSGCGSASSGRPQFLIDTERLCLVPAADHPYLALSYVWGQSPCVSLTRVTRAKLEKEGAFRSLWPLPKTIRQAIKFVKMLGQRHLWVDRLCIDQDDGPAKETQIASMAEIYANSHITIIAAQGRNASAPLYGGGDLISDSDLDATLATKSHGDTEGQSHESLELNLFPREDIMQDLAQALVMSVWYRRGYLDPWPDFHRYVRLVCLFNVRRLTYPEDVLDSFEGTLAALSAVFDGGFVTGLPQMVFDAALLWQPYFPMQRRVAAHTPPEEAVLPSWSWVGWRGSIHSEDWVAGCNYLCNDDNELQLPCSYTISTVAWSHSNSLGVQGTPIAVSAAQYKEQISGRYEDLPAGWHKMGSSSVETSPRSTKTNTHRRTSSVKQYYWHDSDPTQRFWHPIPIHEPSSPVSRPRRSRFLHGRTQAARLQAIRMYPQRATSRRRCADALLFANNLGTGEWVGYMRLNEVSEEVTEQSVEDCRLIELSRGSMIFSESFADRFTEYMYPEFPLSEDQVYEFVNVMWIDETNEVVCFRKAVGRVIKSAWERLPKDDVTMTIG